MSSDPSLVGAAHRVALDQLLEIFDDVLTISPRDFVEKLNTDRAAIDDWRARVAVVGQVKAGKSTFLGALIEKPGFLPSEVNPWTSVVTNLHFGHPNDPQSGGAFHFFDESSWDRIIEGDPETRKMAEDLLPGFQSQVLKMQVETMRARAKKRHGEFFKLLLGKSHLYEVVTADILQRYVCAGLERQEGAITGPSGRYSDLTERADVYLPPGPFAAPTVLSDTPGVNDPFMVRDEYTCRSLGQADIFVMTLSAHQALTDVDIALLKMLALREVNEIIVFINRLDELSGFAEAAPRIVEDVRQRLAEAIPGRDFTVIAGSAFWAELALSAESRREEFEAEIARPEVAAFMQTFNTGEAERDLLAASGLSVVRRALSDAIDFGVGLDMRRRAAATMLDSIAACQSILAKQAEQIDQHLAETDNTSDGAAHKTAKATIGAELSQITETREALSRITDAGRIGLDQAMEEGLTGLRRELDQRMREFADETCEEFFRTVAQDDQQSAFSLDTLPLRAALERTFHANYIAARQRLDRAILDLAAKARSGAEALVSGLSIFEDIAHLPRVEATPVFRSSAQHLTLELTSDRGWKFWKSSRVSPREGAEKLARLIRADFNASIDSFNRTAQEALAERANAAIGEISAICSAAIASIEAQIVELENQRNAAQAEGSEWRADHQRRLKDTRRDIARGAEMLADAKAKIDALTAAPTEPLSKTGTLG